MESWGILFTLNSSLYHDVHFEGDYVFTAGRSRHCSYVFEKQDFINVNRLNIYKNISKNHFQIFKEADDSQVGFTVYFRNLSLNPNFVNGRIIVYGQQIRLSHFSVIALCRRWNEAFRFFVQGGTVTDTDDSDSGDSADTVPCDDQNTLSTDVV